MDHNTNTKQLSYHTTPACVSTPRHSDAEVAPPWSADKVSGDFSHITSVNGEPSNKWSGEATEDMIGTNYVGWMVNREGEAGLRRGWGRVRQGRRLRR